MPKKATRDQIEMYLRLYEVRREPKLRTARDWFIRNYFVENQENFQHIAPPGSEENAYVRMVASYWEMVCNILNLGLLPEEFFFQHTNEFWTVWERLKPTVPAMRQAYRNPHFFSEMEKAAARYEKWMERRAPGCLATLRNVIREMMAQPRPRPAS